MGTAQKVFFALSSLLLLLLGVGLVLPDHAHVERSILIQAAPAQVFPRVNSMRAFHAWSPWSAAAGDTTFAFEGPEQGVGSRMTWTSSNPKVGVGSQEIVRSERDQRVDTKLDFGNREGGEAHFLLEPEAGGTRVTWAFDTSFGWDIQGRFVGLFLDSLIGGEYEKGLQTLKRQLEGGGQPPPAGGPA